MKRIDGKQYSVIRDMIATGSTIVDIAKVAEVSTTTVYSIKNSMNYGDYKAIVNDINNFRLQSV